ncbi:hypothetical protein FRX31_020339 [Thalictrum thalictroides]|uniref:Uncharacterized protein n=1 Tax=Thalictrum thalictroides TaxID=46969 RepID=A0A7J6VYY8_THATH|nr:hypothetical protein FRX31_020339 [Thalictrum thalictroides]
MLKETDGNGRNLKHEITLTHQIEGTEERVCHVDTLTHQIEGTDKESRSYAEVVRSGELSCPPGFLARQEKAGVLDIQNSNQGVEKGKGRKYTCNHMSEVQNHPEIVQSVFQEETGQKEGGDQVENGRENCEGVRE